MFTKNPQNVIKIDFENQRTRSEKIYAILLFFIMYERSLYSKPPTHAHGRQ